MKLLETLSKMDIQIKKSECCLIPSTRKNGRTKYGWREVMKDAVSVNVTYDGKIFTAYVIKEDLESSIGRTVRLYNENGESMTGLWKHGRQGDMIHKEGLEILKEGGKLIETTTYQNGRVKDSYKYLVGIEF